MALSSRRMFSRLGSRSFSRKLFLEIASLNILAQGANKKYETQEEVRFPLRPTVDYKPALPRLKNITHLTDEDRLTSSGSRKAAARDSRLFAKDFAAVERHRVAASV